MSETAPVFEAYDTELYDDFLKYANFEAFQYLDGDKTYRAAQKKSFLSGDIRNPTFDYPKIDLTRINGIETNLLKQKEHILANEQNEAVREAYHWRLNYAIADARLLKAAANGDMNRFQRYSEFVYGKPSADVFAYTVSSIRQKAEQVLSSNNPDLQACAEQILFLLPNIEPSKPFALPDRKTLELAEENLAEEFGDIIIPTFSNSMDDLQIKQAFELALDTLGLEGWQVIIDEKSSRTGVAVNQERKRVEIPAGRRASVEKIAGLIVHEIGTHALRRQNGERSRLKLLGIGLDRYPFGDEGIGTMREQALEDEVEDFAGLDGHLAIGLAMGLDGNPRDFRDVFEIMRNVKLMSNLASGKEFKEALMKAEESAYNRCVRTFRGTDCKTPGVCFTQDIVYREGNIGVWEVSKNNPQEMLRFNIGKYDPANPRHIWVLEQLGITDEDLAELDK